MGSWLDSEEGLPSEYKTEAGRFSKSSEENDARKIEMLITVPCSQIVADPHFTDDEK